MILGGLKPVGQGSITATFKSIDAEGWKLAMGHTLFLQFLSHNLAE